MSFERALHTSFFASSHRSSFGVIGLDPCIFSSLCGLLGLFLKNIYLIWIPQPRQSLLALLSQQIVPLLRPSSPLQLLHGLLWPKNAELRQIGVDSIIYEVNVAPLLRPLQPGLEQPLLSSLPLPQLCDQQKLCLRLPLPSWSWTCHSRRTYGWGMQNAFFAAFSDLLAALDAFFSAAVRVTFAVWRASVGLLFNWNKIGCFYCLQVKWRYLFQFVCCLASFHRAEIRVLKISF